MRSLTVCEGWQQHHLSGALNQYYLPGEQKSYACDAQVTVDLAHRCVSKTEGREGRGLRAPRGFLGRVLKCLWGGLMAPSLQWLQRSVLR